VTIGDVLRAQSDRRLVELAQGGHERAFEAVVHRYRRPLLRYCERLGLSQARAEDVLQHAFLQAWLALERGVEVRELRPWLYRIVHNTAVNLMRSSRDDHRPLSDAAHIHTSVAAEHDLEGRFAAREALADVAALPHMQRQAILLSAVDGRSHEEVADVLGVSHGAVRGLLYRARATLRAAAAAVIPQPLINWASGLGGTGSTTARLAEISAPAGAAGMTGVLLKGAAAAITAGVLVTGAVVAPLHLGGAHAARSGRARTSGAHPAALTGASALPAGGAGRVSHAVWASGGGARSYLRASHLSAATAPSTPSSALGSARAPSTEHRSASDPGARDGLAGGDSSAGQAAHGETALASSDSTQTREPAPAGGSVPPAQESSDAEPEKSSDVAGSSTPEGSGAGAPAGGVSTDEAPEPVGASPSGEAAPRTSEVPQ
jgi:RNA polymerase sigma factor (sigma-70 family)